MGRKNRRLLVPGANSRPATVRVLASALGRGKPREPDLLSAYRSRKFEMPDHGHEGGRMYIGRRGTDRYRSVLTLTSVMCQATVT